MEAQLIKILRQYPVQFAEWKSYKETEAGIKEIAGKIIQLYEPTVSQIDVSKLPLYPLDRILRLWSDIVKIDFNILYGKTRRRPIVTYRQMIASFLWEHNTTFKFTCIEIAKGVGLTHGTVFNSHKQIKNLIETEAEFKKIYSRNIAELKELLKNRE